MSMTINVDDNPIDAHMQILYDKLAEFNIGFDSNKSVELYHNCYLVTLEGISCDQPIYDKISFIKDQLNFIGQNTSYFNPFTNTLNLIIQLNQNMSTNQASKKVIHLDTSSEIPLDPTNDIVIDDPCDCGCTEFLRDADPEKSNFIRTCKGCARPRFGHIA
ncbi:MAG: hypothetical protein ACXAD7_16740 [Candidatus Kariarchaeaceae archaeon]